MYPQLCLTVFPLQASGSPRSRLSMSRRHSHSSIQDTLVGGLNRTSVCDQVLVQHELMGVVERVATPSGVGRHDWHRA